MKLIDRSEVTIARGEQFSGECQALFSERDVRRLRFSFGSDRRLRPCLSAEVSLFQAGG